MSSIFWVDGCHYGFEASQKFPEASEIYGARLYETLIIWCATVRNPYTVRLKWLTVRLKLHMDVDIFP